MTQLLYFFIIFLASTVGAISGMGGGIIIKPTLDLLGRHDLASISFYATVAVCLMAAVSTRRELQEGNKLPIGHLGSLIPSSILGGILGSLCLNWLLVNSQTDEQVRNLQIILTASLLLLALLQSFNQEKSLHFSSILAYGLAGLSLGFISSLLGIGGGPINVSLFLFCFSMPIKQATACSITSILFSQLSKILTLIMTGHIFSYDWLPLVAIIPAAILGGWTGALGKSLLSDRATLRLFRIVLVLILLLNLYNFFN